MQTEVEKITEQVQKHVAGFSDAVLLWATVERLVKGAEDIIAREIALPLQDTATGGDKIAAHWEFWLRSPEKMIAALQIHFVLNENKEATLVFKETVPATFAKIRETYGEKK